MGERAENIEKQEDGSFIVTTNEGTKHQAPSVIIAGGLGSFEPRKPLVENLPAFEKKGIEYMVREPKLFLNKRLFISGSGDSALDWTIYFAENSELPVGLVHRSDMFRAHKDSVDRVCQLQEKGKIELYTHAEIKEVSGDFQLESIELQQKEREPKTIDVDYWLPLFGLSPKLGPIGNLRLEIEKNAIKVDHTLNYQTNTPGVFAVGDVNTYPGKLKLILCEFNETTLAVQSCYKIVNPDKKFTMKYTTVQGVKDFEKVV